MKDETLTAEQRLALLEVLQARFAGNMARHPGATWAGVQAGLAANGRALWALQQMEATGGEPDVVVLDEKQPGTLFVDCAPETPAGRRNLCYDDAALQARKANRPKGSAAGLAAGWGVRLLTEAQYRALQTLGEFDVKTSSWVQTPDEVRTLGGALFCDRRYGRVFVYHNGAESYYGARGFRGALWL